MIDLTHVVVFLQLSATPRLASEKKSLLCRAVREKNDVLLSDAPFMCVALEGNCMHSLILAEIAIGLWAIAGLLAHHAAADRALQCSS